MKRGVAILVVLVVFLSVSGSKASNFVTPRIGVDDLANLLLTQSGLNNNTEALTRLESVLGKLIKKQDQYKNKEDFIEYLYYYTHRKLLKKYEQYPSLAQTLASGDYDCLTATAVYSILLNELSVPHAVVETNYHIYLLVYPDSDQEILLEATDPNHGFVTNVNDIEHLKLVYRQANNELKEGQANLHLNVERRLEGKEILGLLYYNLSIKELNMGNITESEELAKQANLYYPNMRVSKLLEYIDTRVSSASL